jgi:thiol-disulfide isomerase/thioredoxin
MRKLLVAVALIAIAGGTDNPKSTQDKNEASRKEKPAAPLKIGDPAPALRASKWLQGEEVRRFEPGKVYVVEFWATWCGPCIMIMPHLAELHAQHKGVTFIGYSAWDANNTEEQVAKFVKKRGPKLKYTFAYGGDRATYDAWMRAAGQNGIPCAFVVDKAGRIAFIGHPLYLGVVLPRIVAGNATAQAISDEVEKIDDELRAVYRALVGPDAKAGLQALKDFETKYPPLANNPYWLRERLSSLVKAGQVDEVKKFAEAVVARAIKQEDPMAPWMVSMFLSADEGKGSKELMALAVKAAKAMVEVEGDKDAMALMNLANTNFAAGEKAKAKEYARKAVEAAGGEPAALRQNIEKQARKLEDEKKEDKK